MRIPVFTPKNWSQNWLENWTYEKGKSWTQDFIDLNKIKNSDGRPHLNHGIMTYPAHFYAHVCFDDRFKIGGSIHIVTTSHLRKACFEAIKKNDKFTYGSSPLNSARDTGFGFKWLPEISALVCHPFSELDTGEKDMSTRAVNTVNRWLKLTGLYKREATEEEQKTGTDSFIVTNQGVEIKSRNKGYPEVFIQVCETNTDRIII